MGTSYRIKDFAPEPPTGVWALDVHTEIIRRLALLHAAEQDRGLQRWLLERCRQDFYFWDRNFAWVHDPHRPPHKLPADVQWDFQRELVDLFIGNGDDAWIELSTEDVVSAQLERLRELAELGNLHARAMLARDGLGATGQPRKLRNGLVEKSREVGASVVACRASSWLFMFRPKTHLVFVSLKEEKVDDNTEVFDRSLFAKIRNMVRWCPRWMRPRTWCGEKRARFDDRHRLLINSDNGSAVTAQATTADGIRGERAFRVFIDEGNSIPWLDRLLESAQRVGPVIVASSVKGMTTHFARLAHGQAGVPVVAYGEHAGRPGWVKLRWHYSRRPDRDPSTPQGAAWRAAEQAEYTPEAWAQEMEINYEASTPGRIWGPDFDQAHHVITPDDWFEDVAPFTHSAQLWEGWDFGSGAALTSVVWAWYFEANNALYVWDYRFFHAASDQQVADAVAGAGFYTASNPAGIKPYRRVGDSAGSIGAPRLVGGREVKQVGNWIDNLGEHGIDIEGQQLPIEPAIAEIGKALREDRLFFSWRCALERGGLPSLVTCIDQYHRLGAESPHQHKGEQTKPAKDIHSHGADSAQHIAYGVWRRAILRTREVEYQHG